MSTHEVWQPFHRTGAVAPFDADAADREYERTVAARATIAEARELVEQFEKQRPDIMTDIAERRARLPLEPIEAPTAMPEATTAPGAYERALEETIQRRIDTAGVQTDAARLAEREFMIAAVGQALGEALEEVHKRIDQLEHDNLQMRGMLHEHGLAVRSLLPDPHDLLSAKTPLVLARAGSRDVKERAPNRSYPSSNSAPWFSQPYFNADDD